MATTRVAAASEVSGRRELASWPLNLLGAAVAVSLYTGLLGWIYMMAWWVGDAGSGAAPYWLNAVAVAVFTTLVGLATLKAWKFGVSVASFLGLFGFVALLVGSPLSDWTFWSVVQTGALESATWASVPLLLVLSLYVRHRELATEMTDGM